MKGDRAGKMGNGNDGNGGGRHGGRVIRRHTGGTIISQESFRC